MAVNWKFDGIGLQFDDSCWQFEGIWHSDCIYWQLDCIYWQLDDSCWEIYDSIAGSKVN